MVKRFHSDSYNVLKILVNKKIMEYYQYRQYMCIGCTSKACPMMVEMK